MESKRDVPLISKGGIVCIVKLVVKNYRQAPSPCHVLLKLHSVITLTIQYRYLVRPSFRPGALAAL